MAPDVPQDHISRRPVLYTASGMNAVTVRRDEPYKVVDAGALTMDLYYPKDFSKDARLPIVLFVTGFSDVGAQKMFGCTFKEMASFVTWAQLVAASGLVAITYTNREPAIDVRAVLDHVRESAASIGVDETRIGVWSCSGHAPNALSLLMEGAEPHLKCAGLLYPYTIDFEASTGVSNAARQFGFVTPAAGKSVADLRRDIPLFLVRAGRDAMPGLNHALDAFAGESLRQNVPLTLDNFADAPHAFDLFLDNAQTREIVKRMLAFFQFHLKV